MSVLIEPLSLGDLTDVDEGRLRCTIVFGYYSVSVHLFVVSMCYRYILICSV